MSIAALNAVFALSSSRGTARLVLLSIADRADVTGYAFCGNADLQRRTGASRRAIIQGIGELKALGEIRVKTGGGRLANQYWITLPLLPPRAKRTWEDVHSPHGSDADFA